jgi:hypothetical protein
MMPQNGASVYAKLRNAFAAGHVTGAVKMDHALTAYAAEGSLRRLEKAGMINDIVLKGGRLWNILKWLQRTYGGH